MAEPENVSYQLSGEQVRESARVTAEALEEDIQRAEHDGIFFIILIIALFKDLGEIVLDVVGIGLVLALIPVLGKIWGYGLNLILYFFLKQAGWMDAQKEVRRKLQVIFWGLSFFLDNLPVVDALPLTTFTVFYIRKSMKKRAEEAAQELADLQYKTAMEMERLQEEQLAEEAVVQQLYSEETDQRGGEISSEGGSEQSSQKLDIMIGEEALRVDETETSEDAQKKKLSEAEEEAAAGFIPKKVRDPLGKLKKDYFETPPDEQIEDDSIKEAA